MKIHLSSLTAFLLALFCAFPALSRAQYIIERNTPQDSSEFTPTEKSAAKAYPEYHTLNTRSIRLILLEVKNEPDMNYVNFPLTETPPKDLAGILVSLEKIVNIATKAWDIVRDNKPVLNLDTKYATAYPQGITAASQMSQWSKPKTYVYGFYAENMYGGTMIDSKHKVIFSYNGSYKGTGKYLTGVTVVPTVASVSWGYRFHMSATVPDSTIANVGTDADPVASMQLKLTWRMASALKEVEGTSVYYIQADGFFEEIASPWKSTWKDAADVGSAAPLLDPAKVF
ncbi:MAG: hypothetical protein NDI60_10210 [Elusimicrobiales bacterium]|nr:hypothetical protein [Elusimicrobiales bacterium]